MTRFDLGTADAVMRACVLSHGTVAALLGTHVYRGLAPQGLGTDLYVVYKHDTDLPGNDTQRDAEHVVYEFKIVGPTMARIQTVASWLNESIKDKLTSLDMPDWSCYWARRIWQYEYRDPVAGSPVYQITQRYSIMWSGSAIS